MSGDYYSYWNVIGGLFACIAIIHTILLGLILHTLRKRND